MQSSNIQEKSKQTCFINHGVEHPLQNSELAQKAVKNAYTSKDYIFPSGRIEKIQGYEHYMLDQLLQQENINFISHTHPTNTLKILCTQHIDTFANYRLFPDQVVFNGKKSCIVPYAKPGDELTEAIKTHVNLFIKINNEFPKLILLKNHGIIACGKTTEECLIISEICEKAAEIFIGSNLLGNINFLPTFQINSLIFDEKEKYRKSLL
jgi:hypothetical protein